MFVENNLLRLERTDKWIKGNRKLRIMVCAGRKPFFDENLNTHLFNQFPPKTFFGGFSQIDFATRKFPFERHTHGLATLGSENQPVIFDNGAGDVNVFHYRNTQS